jgi:hypothetical protein
MTTTLRELVKQAHEEISARKRARVTAAAAAVEAAKRAEEQVKAAAEAEQLSSARARNFELEDTREVAA